MVLLCYEGLGDVGFVGGGREYMFPIMRSLVMLYLLL